MTQYIYPQNLKATANLWLWSLRDFVILAVAALLSVLALVQLHIFLPAVAVLCYGFLTIRMDDTTVLDFMRYAVRYPFSEVVDFIEVNESVLEAAEFIGKYDLGHIQFRGRNILGVDSFERRIHFLFGAGKAEIGLTVSAFDFQFNHGNSP